MPLLLPALPACVLLYGMGPSYRRPHAGAVRALGFRQLTRPLGILLVALTAGAAETWLPGFPPGPGVVRNLCGYLSAGLIDSVCRAPHTDRQRWRLCPCCADFSGQLREAGKGPVTTQ